MKPGRPRALLDEDPAPFPEYPGRPMMEVPALFLHGFWWEHQGEPSNPVMAYIRNNLDALKRETRGLDWE
jgi:hypothetical protein